MLCRMVILSVLLLVPTVTVTGCRKDEPQRLSVPQPATAPNSRGPVRGGEALFKQYCAPCHPDGGNVSDPERTLSGSALKRNHISTPDDIVRIMRHPLSRMIRFDAATLSDRDARAIAEYVLKTFR